MNNEEIRAKALEIAALILGPDKGTEATRRQLRESSQPEFIAPYFRLADLLEQDICSKRQA
jgi:hypothetical protein